jgi:hypothetical protein
MKVAVGFLLVGIMLLILMLLKADVRFRDGTVDLHLHDTYFVIHPLHFVVVVLLFSLTLFAIGGVIGTGLKNKAFLLTLLVSFALNGFVVWWFFSHLNRG